MKRLMIVLLAGACGFFGLIVNFRVASPNEKTEKSVAESLIAAKAAPDDLAPLSKPAFKFAVSAPVSTFAPAQPETGKSSRKIERKQLETVREIKNEKTVRTALANVKHDQDAAVARANSEAMPLPELTFDGLSSNDTAAAFGFRAIPPDPTGDVGLNYYVQATNLLVRVFDKTGAPLTPGFKLSQLYANLGTVCSRRDDGDPIVLYDQLADRWLLSSFCTAQPPFRQIIAISESGDPTGRYFVYEFVMPNNKLNDYAKLAVWNQSFLMTTDQFVGSDFAGTGAFAFDREKMLAGDQTANYVYYDLASPTTIRLGGMLPADLDGLKPPPAEAPGIFVSYTANEYVDQTDAIKLFEFKPNFQNPRNSTFVERAESPLSVAAFDPTSNPDRTDIRQPAPGDWLDAQSDRLMYRVAYRNFGDSEALVFNQTVRVSQPGEDYRAGVRLYELRKNAGSSQFAVRTDTTAAFDNLSRWMGSAAQDSAGNLAVGYSTSNGEKVPSIAYTGRLAADAPGTLRGEAFLQNGTGVQTAFGFRWGDYSTMSVDPIDDCTFWYTNEYYTAESQAQSPFGWLTRVGKFKFPTCQSAAQSVLSGVVRNAQNNQPIQNARLQTSDGFSRATDANGAYNFRFPPNTYTLTVSAGGFRAQTVTIDLNNAGSIKDFELQPIAVLQNDSIEITAESCARDFAVEPGETATINLPIRNTGALNTANLTVTLLSTGGVTNPSQPQNYGALLPNQTATRAFTFAAANNLNCGAEIVLTFALRDAAEDLGAITIRLNAGKEKISLRQRFDSTPPGKIPFGWTTAASGAQTIWQTVRERSNTYPNAIFSPESFQAGVNELVSPAFAVTSNTAVLRFRNKYDLESTFLRNKLYDGAVLEIKIGAAEWTDVIAAGGEFVSGGYDGVLDSCCQNPLAGRRAWSSKSGIEQEAQFITTEIILPANAANQTVQLRWRVGTDVGGRRTGQWIDDVTISDGFVCSCAD